MISRRSFLASTTLAVCLPTVAGAAPSRIRFSGSMQQGGLVVGHTESRATLAVDGKSVSVSPDGMFAFGIPYNRTDAVELNLQVADGTSETCSVVPIVRHYEIQSIAGLPQKFVTPSSVDEARSKAEHARLAEARMVDMPQTWFSEPFDWPFPGIVSSIYGSQRIDNGTPMAPHLGVDIAAASGTPIRAPAGAQVAIAEPFFLEGNFTMLDHGHGVFSEYLHQSEFKAKVGDIVQRGDVIGLVGQTGRATGPHSHWGLNWFGVKLDPSLITRTPLPPKA